MIVAFSSIVSAVNVILSTLYLTSHPYVNWSLSKSGINVHPGTVKLYNLASLLFLYASILYVLSAPSSDSTFINTSFSPILKLFPITVTVDVELVFS